MNDALAIDNYLMYRLAPDMRLLFEARLLLEPELKLRLHSQKEVMAIAERYGREQLRQHIQAAEARVFVQPRFSDFQNRIKQLFGL